MQTNRFCYKKTEIGSYILDINYDTLMLGVPTMSFAMHQVHQSFELCSKLPFISMLKFQVMTQKKCPEYTYIQLHLPRLSHQLGLSKMLSVFEQIYRN